MQDRLRLHGSDRNTPLGTVRSYRKVRRWDCVLWYPMYFIGGSVIHGYPSVSAYPAAHGCVRNSTSIAPALFDAHGYGTTWLVDL